MGTSIVELIKHERKKHGITKKGLYAGICSLSTATRIEQGERIPDYLTLQAILDRLDISMKFFCAYLSDDEIAYVKWRKEVIIGASMEDDTSLDSLVNMEPTCESLNQKLRDQFREYIKGVNCCRKQMKEAALNHFKMSLGYTNDELCSKGVTKAGTYTSFEMFLYLLILQMTEMCGNSAEEEMKRTIVWVQDKASYNRNMINVLMHAYCILQDNYPEDISEELKERILYYLKKKKTLFHITDILNTMGVYSEARDAFAALNKSYGLCMQYRYWIPYWEESGLEYQKSYIRGGRIIEGKTQVQVAEGIMEVENYSRIETGQAKPAWKNYKRITDKVGLDDRYITTDVSTSKSEILNLAKEIVHDMNMSNIEKVKEKLAVFLDKAENNITNKRFYTAYYYAILSKMAKTRDELKSVLEELRKAFCSNIQWELIGEKVYKYNMSDLIFINSLASITERLGEYEYTKLFLEKIYNDFHIENDESSSRPLEHMGVILNLCRAYSDNHDYSKAYGLSNQLVDVILKLKEPCFLSDVLLEHVYNILNLDSKSDEKQIISTIHPIARFYEDWIVLNYCDQILADCSTDVM